jgi:hypothetical protein
MFHNPSGTLIYLVSTLRVGTNRSDALHFLIHYARARVENLHGGCLRHPARNRSGLGSLVPILRSLARSRHW